MDVIRAYFDKSVKQSSRLYDDYVRVVDHDEKGEEFVHWEKFDYPKHQKEMGPVDNWSLENLMKAGIDPNFGISTGYNTRIEGISDIEKMSEVADKLINEPTNSTNEPKTNE